jgi:hypothetical protein
MKRTMTSLLSWLGTAEILPSLTCHERTCCGRKKEDIHMTEDVEAAGELKKSFTLSPLMGSRGEIDTITLQHGVDWGEHFHSLSSHGVVWKKKSTFSCLME